MICSIFDCNGTLVNQIVADESFAQSYCEDNGYTYKSTPEPAAHTPPSAIEQLRADVDFLAALQGVSL